MKSIVAAVLLTNPSWAQQAGTLKTEAAPKMPIEQCDKSGCKALETSIVLDANWRWTHETKGSTNCYTGNKWSTTACPDGETCAKNCALDGADYAKTYGIKADKGGVTMQFVTNGGGQKNAGSRIYLLDNDNYFMFNLTAMEFTVDVDISQLPCGINGALYFVSMDADGGMVASEGRNTAGAKYGTGYCDAQCPRDIKWINGLANVKGWTPTSPDTGDGDLCSCCSEMDIVEANSISNAYTSHPCKAEGLKVSKGESCDKGPELVCDKPGCDLNPYRMGITKFYGPGAGFTINTQKPFTVVTQFHTDNKKPEGELTEIRRIYIQDGKNHEFPTFKLGGSKEGSSITEEVCQATKKLFGDKDEHTRVGGLKQMGEALRKGMVLAMSIWADKKAMCLWLDSIYPPKADPKKPGVARGTCPTSSGVPKDVEAQYPEATVKFSNIRYGPIGSTFKDVGGSGAGKVSASAGTTEPLAESAASPTSGAGGTGAPSTETEKESKETTTEAPGTTTEAPGTTTGAPGTTPGATETTPEATDPAAGGKETEIVAPDAHGDPKQNANPPTAPDAGASKCSYRRRA